MVFLKILPAGYGHFEITYYHRGKKKTRVTNNTLATDRWRERDYVTPRTKVHGYTEAQAYKALTRP